MESYNIHAAKTHLSKLVARAEHGEEILISRAGKTAARLMPPAAPQRKLKKRQSGQWTGKVWYAPDYDQADAEIEKMFEDSINEDWEELYGIPDPSKKSRAGDNKKDKNGK